MPTKTAAGLATVLCVFARAGSAQQAASALPLSTVPLRLVGVATDASRPALSAAFIQCGGPEEKRSARLVAVGERACDAVEVLEVREDVVVIKNLRADRLELLMLAKPGAPPPAAPSRNEAPIEPQRVETPGLFVRPASSDVIEVELRKAVLQRYLADLPEVLGSALATPRYTTGGSGPQSIAGYELSHVKAGGIVEQLALQDGDVLLEYNGQKLDSLTAVASLFSQVPNMSGAKMIVLRDGRKVTFVFAVK
jgi:hypothetical protein